MSLTVGRLSAVAGSVRTMIRVASNGCRTSVPRNRPNGGFERTLVDELANCTLDEPSMEKLKKINNYHYLFIDGRSFAAVVGHPLLRALARAKNFK